VSRLEAEIRLLRQENQRLRASRERNGGIDPVDSDDTSVEMPDEAAGDGIEDVETPQEPSPSDEAMADEIDDPAERRSLVGEDTSGEDEAPAPVAVRDLVVDVDADRGTVRVRFKVFNQQAEGEAFSGYAFVILKGGDAGPDRWVVFPETNVSPQGTVSYQSGFDFHISNYMTIDFQPQPAGNTEAPTVATVLVYDASGRRVLQSDFQLDADR